MVGVALIRTEVLVTTKRFAKRQIDGSSSDESTPLGNRGRLPRLHSFFGTLPGRKWKAMCVSHVCNILQCYSDSPKYKACSLEVAILLYILSTVEIQFDNWYIREMTWWCVSTFRDKIHCLTLCAAHLEPRPSCPQIPCLATISTAKRAAWTGSTPMRVLEARYPSSLSKLKHIHMMSHDVPWCFMIHGNS